MKQINEDKTATDVGRKSPQKPKEQKMKQSVIGAFYKKTTTLSQEDLQTFESEGNDLFNKIKENK